MTSETEALKTNEFLRRRKLRIQQVREQSKEIAKKIRQRTKVEKLRHIADVDEKKKKDYFEKQDKLVKKLEHLYINGLQNVGVGHRNASDVNLQDVVEKVDLSKKRGKEAAAELRKRKQEKLDEQKKLLDRKLQARETANEISREKSSVIASKLSTKSSSCKVIEETDNKTENASANLLSKETSNQCDKGDKPEPVRSDMATQWDFDEMPTEWEPHIPTLALPKDDKESPKESDPKSVEKSGRSKVQNLFALSVEMPSSLRGGLASIPERNERITQRPSLTYVSEYLQNRGLRLRESDTTIQNKKSVDDLQNIKKTLLKTRFRRPEGSESNDVCHVADVQMVPVPSWQPEISCTLCSHHLHHHKRFTNSKQFIPNTDSQFHKIFSAIKPLVRDAPNPTPVLRGQSPFRRSKVCPKEPVKEKVLQRPLRSDDSDGALSRKKSVTTYNHSTRDTKDVPHGDKKLVIRETQPDEDAYSQALKEDSEENTRNKEPKKLQDMRNKVAMTKQHVEKEYKDTMAFLKSIPKDKSKPIKNAYMDVMRQEMEGQDRQRKMQQEFKKIEKESRQYSHLNSNISRSKSASSVNLESDDDTDVKDFQYSWMPVPESEGNFAIHTIPTTFKPSKTNNTVTFSKVDSYHEYRSRHKHTPPTKETASQEKPREKRVVEAVVIDENDNESTDDTSAYDTSSDSLRLKKNDTAPSSEHAGQNVSDPERIIIYKISDHKNKNKEKKHKKLIKKIAKSLSYIDKELLLKTLSEQSSEENKEAPVKMSRKAETTIMFEQLNEGVYKTVNKNGDNITSLNIPDTPREGETAVTDTKDCVCTKKGNSIRKKVGVTWESGDDRSVSRIQNASPEHHKCTCSPKSVSVQRVDGAKSENQPSGSTSTTSFKSFQTTTTDKDNPENNFIKLLDEGGQETGKFYVGASGFLKDNAYEVVIQLRKRDTKDEIKDTSMSDKITKDSEVQQSRASYEADTINTQKNTVDKNVTNSNPSAVESNTFHLERSVSHHDVNTNRTPQDQRNKKEQAVSTQPRVQLKLPLEEQFSQTNHVDKAVYTPFRLDYPVPSYVTIKEPASNPGTSAYTQTTPGSPPNSRPVYLHMSSSTSTAYMSPPELILPNFLRHGKTHSHRQNEIIELIDEKEYCEEYSNCCTCRRCTHARKIILNRTTCSSVKSSNSSSRSKQSDKGKTPPNTVRSCRSDHGYDLRDNMKDTEQTKPTFKKQDSKCNKCRSKTCLKFKRKSRRHMGPYKKYSNQLNQKKSLSDKTLTKLALNPVIKSYVDKLLALNRASLKAVDVMNQDCSSATTPGSSIIDEPWNKDRKKSCVEKKISLEQVKDLLRQQILEHCEKERKKTEHHKRHNHHNSSRTAQNRRNLSLHKIKSLNISKNLCVSKPDTAQSESDYKNGDIILSNLSSTKGKQSSKTTVKSIASKSKLRSKSSPSPREHVNGKPSVSGIVPAKHAPNKASASNNNIVSDDEPSSEQRVETPVWSKSTLPQSQKPLPHSPESDSTGLLPKPQKLPSGMSTQTSQIIDDEIKFMKLAENKLQNMEKIADLTEKCTKRLSNLAKVLEEVRKNKSLAYSQISDSASDSDKKSDENVVPNIQVTPSYDQSLEMRKNTLEEDKSSDKRNPPSNPLARFFNPSFETRNKFFSEDRPEHKETSKPRTPPYDKMELSKPRTPPCNNGKSTNPPSPPCDNVKPKPQTSPCHNVKPTKPRTPPSDNLIATKPRTPPSDKLIPTKPRTPPSDNVRRPLYDEIQNELVQLSDRNREETESPMPLYNPQVRETISPTPSSLRRKEAKGNITSDSSEYTPFLADIPRPDAPEPCNAYLSSNIEIHGDTKTRTKPPPALSRINLKHGQDIVPHELSTVLEIDSPLSVKFKNQSASNESKSEATNTLNQSVTYDKNKKENEPIVSFFRKNPQGNPDLLQSNINISRNPTHVSSTDSSDDFKMPMMDLRLFNEIMLKPFISLHDYAKQCDADVLDEGSNLTEIPREEVINDDLSSFHSDGSLPDVIAELLKRNIINEPFKFETGSNINSTTVSSESTLSVLALSKVRKENKKSFIKNKENVAETSDTMSISSNPDLENAFKQLGMGWASSTLKKTKERLALSSSTNTSSSSMSQFKIKSFNNKQDVPVVVSDTVSTANKSPTTPQKKPVTENAKSAEQQTSIVNSMTVKEFLANELANKITFTHKSYRDETEEEFISLYDTRMPDKLKHSSQMVREECSGDSGPSGNGNRARTSTPVQLFRSVTYHSSSSSNVSNGLFSNADDLSSVKGTSNSHRNHSTSDKDDLTIPNYSLRMKKGLSDCSKSD